MADQTPSIFVKEFYTDFKEAWRYKIGPDGEVALDRRKNPIEEKYTKEVEYVVYIPKHHGRLQENVERIVDVQRNTLLWPVIEPAYNAWKKGLEMPEHGTPLAAWNGVTPAEAKMLRDNHIRTVEEVAEVTDAIMERLPIARIRELVRAAGLFLKARDGEKVERELAKRDEMIEAMQARMEQMEELLRTEGRDLEPQPVKRRPGRPRKVQPEASQDEAAA